MVSESGSYVKWPYGFSPLTLPFIRSTSNQGILINIRAHRMIFLMEMCQTLESKSMPKKSLSSKLPQKLYVY